MLACWLEDGELFMGGKILNPAGAGCYSGRSELACWVAAGYGWWWWIGLVVVVDWLARWWWRNIAA